jgi:hypothetical protein
MLQGNLMKQLQQKDHRMKKTPKTLYHYTTANGLLGILDTSYLMASNVLYMNDLSELKYPIRQIKCALSKALRSKNKPDSSFELLNLINTHGIYAGCFCKEGDDLSQWRTYSQNGTGYSIGFDLRKLKRSYEIMPPPNGHPYLTEIIYDGNDQKTKLDMLARAITLNESNVNCTFFNSMVSFKNPAFKLEAEWRAFKIVEQDSTSPPVKFREMRGTVIPYIEMSLPALDPSRSNLLPIVEIVQGPLADPELGEKALRLMLNSYGYSSDLIIRKSVVPLRFR